MMLLSQPKIQPDNLVNMHDHMTEFDYAIDVVYAREGQDNLFGPVYRPDAKLWLHRDLAEIVWKASTILKDEFEYSLILYDGLRTVEAQQTMLNSLAVRANPHWLEEPRLLSPPGAGAHPRGMAIDLTARDETGKPIDMGTAFDHLSESPDDNPAHRDYPHPEHIQKNRQILTGAMMLAAEKLNRELIPLPQEWWDFRFPNHVYEKFKPISDSHLPDHMKMT